MTTAAEHELSVTVHIDAPRAVVWRAWSERLPEWWAPKPWTTEVVALDLHPGGRCATIMRGPNGEAFPNEGVVLEAVPEQRIVFTDAYRVGWVPQPGFMTAIMAFADEGLGTRYTATARHWDADAMRRHEEMGFHPGWDIVAGQLKAIAEEMAAAG